MDINGFKMWLILSDRLKCVSLKRREHAYPSTTDWFYRQAKYDRRVTEPSDCDVT